MKIARQIYQHKSEIFQTIFSRTCFIKIPVATKAAQVCPCPVFTSRAK